MRHSNPDAGDQPVVFFFFIRECSAAWLFLGLVDIHTVHCVTLKPGVAVNIAAFRQVSACLVADFLIMLLPFVGSTQPLDLPVFQADNQVVPQGMAFFLPL